MKRYNILVDLEEVIEAENEEEALRKAKELIESGAYSLLIVDEEEV